MGSYARSLPAVCTQTRAALCSIGAQLGDAALDARHAAAAAAEASEDAEEGAAAARQRRMAPSVRVVVGVCSSADLDAIEARPRERWRVV